MSLQDPLADLFSRIRNAQMRNKKVVSSPASKLRAGILDVLAKEGYTSRLQQDLESPPNPSEEPNDKPAT